MFSVNERLSSSELSLHKSLPSKTLTATASPSIGFPLRSGCGLRKRTLHESLIELEFNTLPTTNFKMSKVVSAGDSIQLWTDEELRANVGQVSRFDFY